MYKLLEIIRPHVLQNHKKGHGRQGAISHRVSRSKNVRITYSKAPRFTRPHPLEDQTEADRAGWCRESQSKDLRITKNYPVPRFATPGLLAEMT